MINKNSISLTSEIVCSYMRLFTVLVLKLPTKDESVLNLTCCFGYLNVSIICAYTISLGREIKNY